MSFNSTPIIRITNMSCKKNMKKRMIKKKDTHTRTHRETRTKKGKARVCTIESKSTQQLRWRCIWLIVPRTTGFEATLSSRTTTSSRSTTPPRDLLSGQYKRGGNKTAPSMYGRSIYVRRVYVVCMYVCASCVCCMHVCMYVCIPFLVRPTNFRLLKGEALNQTARTDHLRIIPTRWSRSFGADRSIYR